jgi:hypothetical protein
MAATARGDRHVLMLGGFVGTIPGGDATGHPQVVVPGTEDYSTLACQRLRPRAEAYAQAYNAQVLSDKSSSQTSASKP